ncbi:MAG: hypothetical protein ABI599_10965 [Flavobacteriales bacterium]
MNTPNNFDELSRRKLAEREFPFEEAHWVDVQRALNSDRKRKAAWFPWAAGALLLIGVGTWLAIDGTDDAAEVVQLPTPESNSATAPAVVEQPATASPVQPSQEPSMQASLPTTGVAQNTGSTEQLSIAAKKSSRTTERSFPVKEQDMSEGVIVERKRPSQTATGSAASATHLQTSPVSGSVPSIAAGPITEVVQTGSIAATDTLIEPMANGANEANDHQPEEPASKGQATMVAAEESAPTSVNELAIEPAVEASPSATSDSILASTEPITLPRVTPTVHWEVGVLGGALSTWSRYAGGNSVEWVNALSNGTTATFGAEIMRMGRNTGIGSGIHYTSYAERFSEADRFRTDIDYRNYYFLTTIDTTVTIVVDIDTTGGDTSYITQQVTTSLMVLGSGVDTVSNTTLTSEARKHVNVVSYLEIPLLFDAHLTQGRWNLGVRGGPFLGVLTGRRGALPNAAWDGYMDLADQQFRSVVFGYTARAYVRYRFNAAWSLGLEPCIRGQLIDAHGDDGVTRRSTGAGALLSVSYSLR